MLSIQRQQRDIVEDTGKIKWLWTGHVARHTEVAGREKPKNGDPDNSRNVQDDPKYDAI